MKFKSNKEKIDYLEHQLRKYKRLSYRDTLTGLLNRRKLKIDLKRYMELQKRHRIKFTIMMIDIDNFKKINDKYGHKLGDKMLKKTAKILQQSIRCFHKVYRLGGDEFVIALSHIRKHKTIANRVKGTLHKAGINVSVGYAPLNKGILNIIDKRMYEEKRKK